MSALSMRAPSAQRLAVIGAAGALAFFTLAALRFGAAALALPLLGVGALALIQRPKLAVALAVVPMVLVEGSADDFLGFPRLYNPIRLGLTPMECLLGLAVLAVLLERMRTGRPLRLAGPLALPLGLVLLAILAGSLTGVFEGEAPRDILFGSRQLAWLVIVPLLVVNVVETRRQVRVALALGAGLAAVKAAIGVAGVVAGVGLVVDGATITYYEPTANWMVLLALLIVSAALLSRAHPPAWVVVTAPLLILSLGLSFRRSFWIGAALGLLLVLIIAWRPTGRRVIFLGAILMAFWTLSLQPVQTEAPIVERAASP